MSMISNAMTNIQGNVEEHSPQKYVGQEEYNGIAHMM